jgi:GTP-binding protein HflX
VSEKAILVSVETNRPNYFSSEDSMEELGRLAETAGATVVGTLYQKLDKPNSSYFIGSGKLNELKALAAAKGADLIIFDQDINAAQENNLSEELNRKIINRTELILDIFALHAHSREGKLQVELAQNEFFLTRLVGQGTQLSRLGGGIGTRGPGETKLEYDRRVIRKKVSQLKKELQGLKDARKLRREKRTSSSLKQVSIVGYTNAGKSTLLNALTKANVYAADQLFATLDPTTRRLYLPSSDETKLGNTILLSDTVGFIQNLPHQLIEAFSATLEEVTDADLLINVIDASNLHFEGQIEAVCGVLEGLNAFTKPMINVFNKIDLLPRKTLSKSVLKKYSPSIAVSAQNSKGMDELKLLIAKQLG